ncbi:MAG: hypothetical protein ACYC42_10970 [Lysobacter sp.]
MSLLLIADPQSQSPAIRGDDGDRLLDEATAMECLNKSLFILPANAGTSEANYPV